MTTFAVPPEGYARAIARMQARGWEVLGLCPECHWGLMVKINGGRTRCTAYGQCELAPG